MTLQQLEAVDAGVFRDAVRHHAAGVAVVTAVADQVPVGMTVSTFASHSLAPPTVSCDLAATSGTLATIRDSRRFAVHLLSSDQEALAVRFAGSKPDRFAEVRWWWCDGLPALDGVLARFTCHLLTDVAVGDHSVVFGAVTDVAVERGRGPLIHQDRRFHRLPCP